MNRVITSLSALALCSLLAAMSVGCVHKTIIEQEESSESDQTQSSEMVGYDSNGDETSTTDRPARTLNNAACTQCGPLPDPWTTMGPLPDPWQAKHPSSAAAEPDTSKSGKTGSGNSHKD